MQDVIVSKRCSRCAEVLSLDCFRRVRRKTCDGYTAACVDCENEIRRTRRGKPSRPAHRPWTPVEDSLILQLYPDGGSAACMPVLPGRGDNAIKQRACRLDVQHSASPHSQPHNRAESLWGVPVHDYTPEDRAWMNTRMPVFGGGFGVARIAA